MKQLDITTRREKAEGNHELHLSAFILWSPGRPVLGISALLLPAPSRIKQPTYTKRKRPAHTYPAHRPPSHSGQGLKSTERQKIIENSQRPRTQFQSRPRHTAQLAQPPPQGQLGELQPARLHTQHEGQPSQLQNHQLLIAGDDLFLLIFT